MSWLSSVLLGGVRAAFAPSARHFRAALANPEQAQRERLHAVLASTADTEQGRRFGLAQVRTAADFQAAVPIRTYDEIEPDVRASFERGGSILTSTPVARFELSGGSGGASKLVPMTEGLAAEFHRALAPWLFDLLDQRPRLRGGPGYWSISPLGQRKNRSPAGIPVGSAEDAAYFPRVLQPLLRRALAVPGDVARLPDVERCRYVTLWHLVACEDLRLISVWNPSFLTLMLESLDASAQQLAADLNAGTCWGALEGMCFSPRPDRARTLREAVDFRGRVDVRRLWPSLSLVSLWTDADAARALPAARERLQGVELQGKGLLATEGVVTLPLFDAPAPVLAIRSHFYEFIPVDAPRATPQLAHEVELGKTYDVVMSTSGGLLRYRLGDRVRVEGFVGRTPCLRFLGRSDSVCDLVGEKLSAARVRELLDEMLRGIPARFAMLAPEWEPRAAYWLFVDASVDERLLERLGGELDRRLCEGHAYGYARRLGQLGPLQVARVSEALRRYEARCVQLGQRAGDVKPQALHRTAGWREAFEVGR